MPRIISRTGRLPVAKGVVAAGLALGVLALTACGSAPATPAQALPEPNIGQWELPLNRFIRTWVEVKRQDYAENLLVEQCMEKAGYPWPVPALDPNISRGPSWNEYSRKLFTRELASRWGYHEAPGRNAAAQAEAEFAEIANSLSSEGNAALDGCVAEARTRMPDDSDALTAEGFVAAAYLSAQSEPAVVEASTAWRSCMLPLGISDLPDSPADFPTPSLSAEFGFSGQDGAETPPVSNREREVAVADFDCQESSGYRKATYDAEWDAQVALVRENADALNRGAKALVSMNEAVAQLIVENVGHG